MMIARSRRPEPPFCWQSKEALRLIREHLDGDTLLPYALGAYFALTENASNKGAEEFTTLQSHLAELAGGFSVRTLQRVLPMLREIGVVDYTTPRLRGPITFRLLAVPTSSRNDTTPSRNVATRKKTAFLADNRKNKERTLEETKEEVGRSSALKSDPIPPPSRAKKIDLVDDEHLREMKELYRARDVDQAVVKCKAWLKTRKGQGKAFTKGRLNTFLKDAEPLAPGQASVNDAPPPPDRRSVDAVEFSAFVHQRYRGDAQRAWTPDTAPEHVVRDFLNNT